MSFVTFLLCITPSQVPGPWEAASCPGAGWPVAARCLCTWAQLPLWSAEQAFHPPSFLLNDSLVFDPHHFLSFFFLLHNESLGGEERRSAPKGHNFYEHLGCLTFISWANMPEGVSPSRPLIDKIRSPDNWRKLERRGGGGEGMRSRGKCP